MSECDEAFEAAYLAALRDSQPGTLKDIAYLCWQAARAQPAQEVPPGMVLMPESALRWLFGEEGIFECPPERYRRGTAPTYWWRSVLREKMGAKP